MSYIGPITQNLLDTCIREFKKKDTKDKVEKLVFTPVMNRISEKIFYYFLFFMLSQIVIIILILILIFYKFS